MAEPTSCSAGPGGCCARVDTLFNLSGVQVLDVAWQDTGPLTPAGLRLVVETGPTRQVAQAVEWSQSPVVPSHPRQQSCESARCCCCHRRTHLHTGEDAEITNAHGSPSSTTFHTRPAPDRLPVLRAPAWAGEQATVDSGRAVRGAGHRVTVAGDHDPVRHAAPLLGNRQPKTVS